MLVFTTTGLTALCLQLGLKKHKDERKVLTSNLMWWLLCCFSSVQPETWRVASCPLEGLPGKGAPWEDPVHMEASLQACSLACPEEERHTDHAWDASCQAAVVACPAAGALCCPQPPQGAQPHGPDPAWEWDAGNEAAGLSSPPVGRTTHKANTQTTERLSGPVQYRDKHSQKMRRNWVPMLACPDFTLRIFKFRIILQHNHKRETTKSNGIKAKCSI